MSQANELAVAINGVVKDTSISNREKVERIEFYLDVYFGNKNPSMSGMV